MTLIPLAAFKKKKSKRQKSAGIEYVPYLLRYYTGERKVKNEFTIRLGYARC